MTQDPTTLYKQPPFPVQKTFGSKTPFGRAGQPVEVAPPYVMLASDEASYISGAMITVAGGMPIF